MALHYYLFNYCRPRDTNRFIVSIHVAALSEVTFTLNYNELLQRRRGNYEHTIYINPRQIVDDLLLEVTIQEFRPITHLHVPPLRNDILTHFSNSSKCKCEIDMSKNLHYQGRGLIRNHIFIREDIKVNTIIKLSGQLMFMKIAYFYSILLCI